jgi:6-pyruvoyltetrahydropterin/6-carboxytetrahydropterin synthase
VSLNVSFSRVYQFSAAHRLHSLLLNDKENIEVYDKCNNFYGHGHDYTVEVTIKGEVDPLTGMIMPLPKLDSAVNDLLKMLDHKHLNFEVPYFKDHISTGEIIIQYIWDELNKRIPDNKLYHIKLWETNNNFFELGKEPAS